MSDLRIWAVAVATGCAAAAAWGGAGRAERLPYRLGIAGYTYHRVKDVDRVCAAMRSYDCHYLCHKDFLLGYDADDAAIAAYKAKLAGYGIETLATGPVYMRDEETARRTFAFAKRFGLKTVVGVPFETAADGRTRVESDRMLDVVERLVREYDIRFAIHNHGPDLPKLFPTAEAALERIGGRDRRLGVCLDVGHERRAGLDPVAFIRAHGDRIYDVHLKNIRVDPVRNLAVEGPRGELDVPAILQALADVGYAGGVHVEYEKDFENNLLPLAESVGYYRGCMDSVRAKVALEPVPAGANALTDAEKADGWELLWDGRSEPDQWVGDRRYGYRSFPDRGWRWANGELWMLPVRAVRDGKWTDLPPEDAKLGGGGCIQTRKRYRDFHFKADFKLTEAANSGIKYFFDENQNGSSCEEFQLLDRGHPDYDVAGGTHRVGALYDLMAAPLAERALRPLGRWNTAEVISKGRHVEHWLNGVKVLEYERGGAAFRAAVAKSKYAKWGRDAAGRPQPWGELPEGRIHLQDHSDSKVYFCNLKVREL